MCKDEERFQLDLWDLRNTQEPQKKGEDDHSAGDNSPKPKTTTQSQKITSPSSPLSTVQPKPKVTTQTTATDKPIAINRTATTHVSTATTPSISRYKREIGVKSNSTLNNGNTKDPIMKGRVDTKPKVYSVRQIVGKAASVLETGFGQIWVEGEVSNFSKSPAGHLYFTLKEETAQLSVVMFRSAARKLNSSPQNGKQIRCRGRLSIYAPSGRFQLYAERIELTGLGELLAAMERLKKKLAGEGLFDVKKKRALPPFPKKIGVVTSPVGAAIQDIHNVLKRRWPVCLVLSPAPVQGAEAPGKLVSALKKLEKIPHVDLIIFGRGGGSTEDLAAFSEEAVVRAVAACSVPIISAVGHEVDTSLCDFAADKTAPTPSAAAELAVPRLDKVTEELFMRRRTMVSQIRSRIEHEKLRLAGNIHSLKEPTRALAEARQYLDNLNRKLGNSVNSTLKVQRINIRNKNEQLRAAHPARRLKARRRALDTQKTRIQRQIDVFLAKRKDLLNNLKSRLNRHGVNLVPKGRTKLASARGRLIGLNPLSVLERGYSLVTDKTGQVIRDYRKTRTGDKLDVRLHHGGLECTVSLTHPPENSESAENTGSSEQTKKTVTADFCQNEQKTSYTE